MILYEATIYDVVLTYTWPFSLGKESDLYLHPLTDECTGPKPIDQSKHATSSSTAFDVYQHAPHLT